MKHLIVAARMRSQLTVSELQKEHAACDAKRLLERGMVPGALITEGSGTVPALLVVVNIHGRTGLPPGLFTSVDPALLKEASLVLVRGAGSTSRLATIMTTSLLTGFWRLVRKDSGDDHAG